MISPETLYVIGNGFDLWHGIPSKYSDFRNFIRANDRELFQQLENYLPVEDDWSNLESALADLDVDFLIDNHGCFLTPYGAEDWSDSGHHDFQYEIEQVVRQLSSELLTQFTRWVRSIDVTQSADARLNLETSSSVFLNFNYTGTLNSLYGIAPERILHIHGCAEKTDQDLVLGHAWNPSMRPSLNDFDGVEDLDVRLHEAHSIIDSYFASTFKPTAEILKQHDQFFRNLSNVSKVLVLGHSLSEVDAGYIRAVHEVCGEVTDWRVASRDPAKETGRVNLLRSIGVGEDQIQWFPWSQF
ncbi:MAG: bacteriophage abortive infection AbiH family protein [Luteolibacter sp.]